MEIVIRILLVIIVYIVKELFNETKEQKIIAIHISSYLNKR